MARDSFKITARFTAKDEASTKIKGLRGAFGSLQKFISDRLVITLGDLAHVFTTVAGAIGSSIDAAQRQEDAVKNLEASLSKYGEAGVAAAKSAEEYAAGLEKVTRFGDEAIIEAQALLATFGATPETLNEATKATVELAAAFGKSLPEAARLVGRTFGGFAGELGEVIPELKDLTAEALHAGGAVGLLSKKFAGRAAADAATYSGAVAQVANAWGSLTEQLGFAITKNAAIRTSLNNLKNTLSSENFKQNIESLANGIASIAEVAVKAAAALGWLVDAYTRLQRFITKHGIPGFVAGKGDVYEKQLAAMQALIEQEEFVKEALEKEKVAGEAAAKAAAAKAEADRLAAEEAKKRAKAEDDLGETIQDGTVAYVGAVEAVETYGRAATTAAASIREFTTAQIAANEASGGFTGIGTSGITPTGALLPGATIGGLLEARGNVRNRLPISTHGAAYRVNDDGSITFLTGGANVRGALPPGGITVR